MIARTSSVQYKQTTKSPQQIGQELGVDYLLTGTVRWEKEAGGQSRVQVSPELVQVSTASTRWQAPFEAPLTDVFRVQADIAGRVAEALGVALGAGERERLAERPTENLAAYDAFLRARRRPGAAIDLAALRRAHRLLRAAVALDSTFALAWAQLSRAHSSIYLRRARTLPGRRPLAGPPSARWRSRPSCPTGTAPSRIYYYVRAVRLTARTRAVHDGRGSSRRRTPCSCPWSPQNELVLGHAEEALEHLRAGAGARSPLGRDRDNLTVCALLGLRRYSEALAAAERGLALAPDDLVLIDAAVEAHLAQGDLAGARAVLRAVPREVDPAALVAYIATGRSLLGAGRRAAAAAPPALARAVR